MLPEPEAGGAVTGAILVDQVKSIDAKARNIQDSGQRVESGQMDEVLARLATLTA
jgi:mRNA-degrading endonuclease toxin of MazEF toxin-antitoxin module